MDEVRAQIAEHATGKHGDAEAAAPKTSSRQGRDREVRDGEDRGSATSAEEVDTVEESVEA